ncbi:MAG: DegT/DnrJ/EryC1/StrS family aminotransferase, partial [Reinekea sp.]|nr:DegT/DnrJ/EryC1/StrS family aminotransferase [Reinekea sp.]
MYTDSGTTALAFALFCLARDSHFENPGEVIVPGYCCPDLVSAVVYAGLKPVIVDVSDIDPSFELHKMRSSINISTLSIIEIHFLCVL